MNDEADRSDLVFIAPVDKVGYVSNVWCAACVSHEGGHVPLCPRLKRGSFKVLKSNFKVDHFRLCPACRAEVREREST